MAANGSGVPLLRATAATPSLLSSAPRDVPAGKRIRATLDATVRELSSSDAAQYRPCGYATRNEHPVYILMSFGEKVGSCIQWTTFYPSQPNCAQFNGFLNLEINEETKNAY